MRHHRVARSILLAPLLALAAACGGDLHGSGGGDFGATPGGVKDLKLARELIANGQIPPAAALLVEAMFAEHDLGLTGAPCNDTLCLRTALGVAPDRDGDPRGWLQVGLSSNVVPELFQRPATTFIFAVDVSGSMGWGSGGEEYPTPGYLSRRLMHGLVDAIDGGDQVAIVTYGSSVRTPLGLTSGADKAAIRGVVDGLREGGATDMHGGLVRAYELGRQARAAGRPHVRVVLFTDVQPNVGPTSPTAFDDLVSRGAADGVHISVLALGLGVGPEVLQSMAKVRGANAFSMQRAEDVASFMADEWPWFASPIAYDLGVEVRHSAGLAIEQGYGFPVGFGEEPRLEVATVFLSKRRGALLVSLVEAEEGALALAYADAELRWVNPAGVPRVTTLRASRDGAPLDERGHWFAQEATARTTALALLVSGMHDAAASYAGDPALATTIMRAAHDRFAADAAALADPTLTPEVELAAAMLRLIEERAPQGTLYGP
ncbi:MAG: VWA domain-containing protein [Kofleriaceae bacterium]|nr:VWA domain-containing protein [Kofleriaceae bacterium]MCL4226305.1 VWA domain-containing protein [Myxococcales bacterium]